MGFLDKFKGKAAQPVNVPYPQVPPEISDTDAENRDKARKKVEDILEVLRIQASFEIPPDVLLPGDRALDIRFDTQVPSGYDPNQVDRFVYKVKTSVAFLVSLLERRNEDIAKLATVVDRLQVDANNLRFESEIANGVSVMPTQDDESLDTLLMEEKLKVRRLEDELKVLKALSGGISSRAAEDHNSHMKAMDDLSVMKAQLESLEFENTELKTRLAQIEEDSEDDFAQITAPKKPLSADQLNQLGVSLEPVATTDVREAELPELSDSLPSLPPLDGLVVKRPTPSLPPLDVEVDPKSLSIKLPPKYEDGELPKDDLKPEDIAFIDDFNFGTFEELPEEE